MSNFHSILQRIISLWWNWRLTFISCQYRFMGNQLCVIRYFWRREKQRSFGGLPSSNTSFFLNKGGKILSQINWYKILGQFYVSWNYCRGLIVMIKWLSFLNRYYYAAELNLIPNAIKHLHLFFFNNIGTY